MENKRKVILYIAQSLDGYIAGEDDSLEWLLKAEGEGDNGFSEFYETIDTVLIGRRTYEEILKIEKGKFPYEGKKKYVFSSTIKDGVKDVHYTTEKVASLTKKLKVEDGGDIWIVGGSMLIQELLKEGLIDEFIIQFAPTIIGKGIPLFLENDFQVELSLKDVRRYNQFAHLHYELKK